VSDQHRVNPDRIYIYIYIYIIYIYIYIYIVCVYNLRTCATLEGERSEGHVLEHKLAQALEQVGVVLGDESRSERLSLLGEVRFGGLGRLQQQRHVGVLLKQ